MNGLLSHLLDLHQSREGTLSLALSEFDVAALFHDVASEARVGRAGTNRQTVELAVSAPQRVRADRGMLRRVLEQGGDFDGAALHALTGQGRGLGLAFCRMAVEAHSGQIRVESNGGRGSCFVVTLPGEGSSP
jgi:signal transduction histidine kinase